MGDSELQFAQKINEKKEQFCSTPVKTPHTISVVSSLLVAFVALPS